MSRISLLKRGAIYAVELTATGLEPRTTYFISEHSTIWLNLTNDCGELRVLICAVHLTICCYHVTYAFQSESTLYTGLNVKNSLLETGAISEV